LSPWPSAAAPSWWPPPAQTLKCSEAWFRLLWFLSAVLFFRLVTRTGAGAIAATGPQENAIGPPRLFLPPVRQRPPTPLEVKNDVTGKYQLVLLRAVIVGG
jgi:hypothetical protein